MADERPTRYGLDDPEATWKTGVPNYDLVDAKYLKERSKCHAPDSLERKIENVMKTWEMESTHKPNIEDFRAVVPSEFTLTINGFRYTTDMLAMGSYNVFLYLCPLYDPQRLTSEQAMAVFKGAFPDGFAWEVCEVFSGPPKVSFTWRHWAQWIGPYEGREGTGETLEVFGMGVAEVTDDEPWKMKSVQLFYDPNPFIAKMLKLKKRGCPVAE